MWQDRYRQAVTALEPFPSTEAFIEINKQCKSLDASLSLESHLRRFITKGVAFRAQPITRIRQASYDVVRELFKGESYDLRLDRSSSRALAVARSSSRVLI